MREDWSSAFCHVVPDFYHPFSGSCRIIGDTETQSFNFSYSPPCLCVSSASGW